MKTNHTPGPWKIQPSSPLEDGPSYYDIFFSDGELRSIIARSHVSHLCNEHDGTTYANVEHIVKACNLHDELVSALEAITEHSVRWLDFGSVGGKEEDILNQCRTVLAKAKIEEQ